MLGARLYAIVLRDFDSKLFEEDNGGGVRQGIAWYPYLKHLIELCPWDWVEQLSEMNEDIGERN